MEKRCACGNPLSTPRHTYCPECREQKKKEQKKAYFESDKFKAWRVAYMATPEWQEKNRERSRDYYHKNRQKKQEYARNYIREHPEEHRTRCREWKQKNVIHTCYRCHMPWDKQGNGRICPSCLEREMKEKSKKNRELNAKKSSKLSLSERMDLLREVLKKRKVA